MIYTFLSYIWIKWGSLSCAQSVIMSYHFIFVSNNTGQSWFQCLVAYVRKTTWSSDSEQSRHIVFLFLALCYTGNVRGTQIQC